MNGRRPPSAKRDGITLSDFRKRVFEKSNYICQDCGLDFKPYFDWVKSLFFEPNPKPRPELITPEPEVDHILAVGLGRAEHDIKNCQILCHDCHNKKTRKDREIMRQLKNNIS